MLLICSIFLCCAIAFSDLVFKHPNCRCAINPLIWIVVNYLETSYIVETCPGDFSCWSLFFVGDLQSNMVTSLVSKDGIYFILVVVEYCSVDVLDEYLVDIFKHLLLDLTALTN